MCGILGMIGETSREEFTEALSLMNHRGPDGRGEFHSDNFHLGHLRLSILDLSDLASQPMFSSDKRYCIIFNGEIYNFLQIKEQLISFGYYFESSGDT